ncbi:hypothetical protein EON66_10075, partial [archaeon]
MDSAPLTDAHDARVTPPDFMPLPPAQWHPVVARRLSAAAGTLDDLLCVKPLAFDELLSHMQLLFPPEPQPQALAPDTPIFSLWETQHQARHAFSEHTTGAVQPPLAALRGAPVSSPSTAVATGIPLTVTGCTRDFAGSSNDPSLWLTGAVPLTVLTAWTLCGENKVRACSAPAASQPIHLAYAGVPVHDDCCAQVHSAQHPTSLRTPSARAVSTHRVLRSCIAPDRASFATLGVMSERTGWRFAVSSLPPPPMRGSPTQALAHTHWASQAATSRFLLVADACVRHMWQSVRYLGIEWRAMTKAVRTFFEPLHKLLRDSLPAGSARDTRAFYPRAPMPLVIAELYRCLTVGVHLPCLSTFLEGARADTDIPQLLQRIDTCLTACESLFVKHLVRAAELLVTVHSCLSATLPVSCALRPQLAAAVEE